MADFDRRTGALIDNYASAVQGVEVALGTRVGELVMLREFGGAALPLLGRLLTPTLFGAFQALLMAVIDLWEPRFRVRRIDVAGDVDALRAGRASLSIEVDWRPRAHLGDDTVEGVRRFDLSMTGQTSAGISA